MERARASSTRSSRFLRLLQLALLACVGLLAGCGPHYTPPLMVEQTGAVGAKDMGKVMGMATKTLAGKAEGRMISETVKRLLS